jgi:hypothetical protein
LSYPEEAFPSPDIEQSANTSYFYETRVVYFRFKLPCTSELPSIQEAAKSVPDVIRIVVIAFQ